MVRLTIAFPERSFSLPSAFHFPSLCTTFLSSIPFPPIPLLEKKNRSSRGIILKYCISAFVHLAVNSFTCFHLLMAMVKCKAGMGFPSGWGKAGRSFLWTTKPCTQLGHCICDGESHAEPERKEGRQSQTCQDCWGISCASVMLDSALY